MIVIRRIVDRKRAYTGIFLRGEPAQIFPTSDYEHSRILALFKQDRPYEGIYNDFSDYAFPDVLNALKADPVTAGIATRSESGSAPLQPSTEEPVVSAPNPALFLAVRTQDPATSPVSSG